MGNKTRAKFTIHVFLLALTVSHFHVEAYADHHETRRSTYIVHMDKYVKPAIFDHHSNWYHSSLNSVSDSAELLYAYNNVVHGFSASLTEEEAESLRSRPGVVSVVVEDVYEPHTTRTPDFLGLTGKNKALFPPSEKVSDVVVGVLDSGVWPEIESYGDAGVGQVPGRWKGKCEAGTAFNASLCNRKLIGARFYARAYEKKLGHPMDESAESRSPRDDTGHGTHTSSIVAGSAVKGASLSGYAAGTARGVAPSARVAVYKVCWIGGCFGADVIAAVDGAIEDGVDILSMSLGSSRSRDYHSDNFAVASFAATERGILVSAAGGNSGPTRSSVVNVAPWMLTVGAGSIDRDFPAYLRLGNGKVYKGPGLYVGDNPLSEEDSLVPIVYADGASAGDPIEASVCVAGSLDPKKVAGKIVICDRGGGNSRTEKGLVVKDAGGVGMVLTYEHESNGLELLADVHIVPGLALDLEKGNEVKKYVSSGPAIATITMGETVLGFGPSPMVPAFSSRGPNKLTPEVLKPDVIAPGVNVLAGWTGKLGPTGLARDGMRVAYNIRSGTSMSCPHVSGIAALLKAARPGWSPAAIRSAIMTTAYSTGLDGAKILDAFTGAAATPFELGAGHVDPAAALDPGLVYDAGAEDYLSFLCALNYTANQIKALARRDFACVPGKKYSVRDLNYPSFAVVFSSDLSQTTVTYTRTLTNVGSPGTYRVSVSDVDSVNVVVSPNVLRFRRTNEKKSYSVTFVGRSSPANTQRFGRLEWSDGKHVVGSTIAFTWSKQSNHNSNDNNNNVVRGPDVVFSSRAVV